MGISRRSLLKSLAAVGFMPAVALAAPPIPDHPFGSDCVVIYLSHLNQAYENVQVPMGYDYTYRARWLQHKLQTIRKNNPDKTLVLMIDDPTVVAINGTMPPSSLAYMPDIIVQYQADGRRKVVKDRYRIAGYYI